MPALQAEESHASRMQGGSAVLDKSNVSHLLQEALAELRGVRQQLLLGNSAGVSVALNRAEQGLRRKAAALALPPGPKLSGGSEPNNAGPLHASFKRAPFPWQKGRQPQRQAHLQHDAFAAYKQNLVNNPGSPAARAFIQQQYGVAAPAREAAWHPAGAQQLPRKADSALLPRQNPPGFVQDASGRITALAGAPPTAALSDTDVQQGLLELINRGLLPQHADLTDSLFGQDALLSATVSRLHPYEEQFLRPQFPPSYEAQPTYSSALHLDLRQLHSAQHPAQKPAGAASMSYADLGSSVDPTPRDTLTMTDRSHASTNNGPPSKAMPRTAREYEELMDDYSLHEFMIRHGAVVRSTPEFVSYQRAYTQLWPAIEQLLTQLEEICLRYAVPLGIVDGKALAEVAAFSTAHNEAPLMEDLLVCLRNIRDVADILRQPGQRFKGPNGHTEAVVLIQAHFRGWHTRQCLKARSLHSLAAAHIQETWRRRRSRTRTLIQIHKAQHERDRRFAELQEHLARDWPRIHQYRHVVIHLPCLGTPTEQQLAGNPTTHPAQNAQMARLCDLADPSVDVIYVAPLALGEDVEQYWLKLLQVGGVADAATRYRVIVPENLTRLPHTLSLTAKLLASPRALKRIQLFMRGKLGYIVPGKMGDEEVDLAVRLGLPILAPHPHVAHKYALKSGARALFAAAKLNLPPGRALPPVDQSGSRSTSRADPDRDVSPPSVLTPGRTPLQAGLQFSINPVTGRLEVRQGAADGEEEREQSPHRKRAQKRQRPDKAIIHALAELIVEHPTVPRWLLKIDDESDGRGHAYVDGAAIPAIGRALQQLANPTGGAQDAESVIEAQDAHEVAIYKIAQALRQAMSHTVTLAGQEAYPDWAAYVQAFRQRGGIIEACAGAVTGSPTVNLFIEPTGAVRVVSTHEQIFCPAYRVVGSSFPQSSVPHAALADAATAAGLACFKAKIIGHVAVDFVALRDGGRLRLWAVDLALRSTPSLCSFQMFDFLAAGEFDVRGGTYWVPFEQPAPPAMGFEQQYGAGQQMALDRPAQQAQTAPDSDRLPPVAEDSGGSFDDGDHASADYEAEHAERPPSGSVRSEAETDDLALTARSGSGSQDDGRTTARSGYSLGSEPGTTCPHASHQSTSQPPSASAGGPNHAAPGSADPDTPATTSSQQLQQQQQQAGWQGTHQAASHSASAMPALPQPSTSTIMSQPSHMQSGASDPLAAPQTPDWQKRYYVAIDLLFHPNLGAMRSTHFFHDCRLAGLCFDVRERLGTAFNLMDSFSANTLGMMCVGDSAHAGFEELAEVLEFLLEQFGAAVQPVGTLSLLPSSQKPGQPSPIGNFRNIHATIKYLRERLQAGEAGR